MCRLFAGRQGRHVVPVVITLALPVAVNCHGVATAVAQNDTESARRQWRRGAASPRRRPKVSKPAALIDNAQIDVLVWMSFSTRHRARLHATNPLERLNGEIERQIEVMGIFPNETAIIRLVGAIFLEQSDGWAVRRAGYMTLGTITALGEYPLLGLPGMAA